MAESDENWLLSVSAKECILIQLLERKFDSLY